MPAGKAKAPTKPRPPLKDHFRIRFLIESTRYAVMPLKPDPGAAPKVYRMRKLDAKGGTTAEYDLSVSPEGHPACECRGWLRRQKPCRRAGEIKRGRRGLGPGAWEGEGGYL